ncbi:MAG: hypothetical protein ACTS6H_01220 [Candidatus Hodgkinia cicadicola]
MDHESQLAPTTDDSAKVRKLHRKNLRSSPKTLSLSQIPSIARKDFAPLVDMKTTNLPMLLVSSLEPKNIKAQVREQPAPLGNFGPLNRRFQTKFPQHNSFTKLAEVPNSPSRPPFHQMFQSIRSPHFGVLRLERKLNQINFRVHPFSQFTN